jgi:hypothetical protein
MMREFEKKLQQVDWQNLGMKDIPQWILAFASDDRQMRKGAYMHFDYFVVYKGAESMEDLGRFEEVLETEALVFIVPILIDLLADKDAQDKQSILDVLNQLALNMVSNKDEKREPYHSRAIRVYDAIRVGIPLYRYLYDAVDDFGKAVIKELLETLENEK